MLEKSATFLNWYSAMKMTPIAQKNNVVGPVAISGELLVPDRSVSHLIAIGTSKTPAELYVERHVPGESQRVAQIKADHAAVLLGFKNANSIRWDLINYTHAVVLRSELQKCRARSGDLLSPSTMNHTLIAFRQMAKMAWLCGTIAADQYKILSSIELIGGSRKKVRELPMTADVEALIDACFQDKGVAGARDAAIVTLAFGAGLRRSELVNIRYPDHLYENQCSLHVRGKGNKDRIMPIEPYMLDVIKTWVEDVRGEQPGYLFVRIRKNYDIMDTPLSPAAVRFILERRCLQAGIKVVRPHDARSAYGTNLLNNGTSLVTVRDLLGHSSVTTTERYTQVSQNDMRNAERNNLYILSLLRKTK